MLMDMFYSATEGIVKHRKRYHFHEVGFGITSTHHAHIIHIYTSSMLIF